MFLAISQTSPTSPVGRVGPATPLLLFASYICAGAATIKSDNNPLRAISDCLSTSLPQLIPAQPITLYHTGLHQLWTLNVVMVWLPFLQSISQSASQSTSLSIDTDDRRSCKPPPIVGYTL